MFGILMIVFGAFGLCGIIGLIFLFNMPANMAGNNPTLDAINSSDFYRVYTIVTSLLGSIVGILGVVSGIGLLKGKEWARMLALGYAVYGIIVCIINGPVQWIYLIQPMMANPANQGPAAAGAIGGAIGGLAGSVLGLIFPACILWFLTRPHVVAYCQGEAQPTQPTWG